MKKLINASAILSVLGLAAFMAGCGGGGDSGGSSSGGGQATSYAPAKVDNKMVTLTQNGQSQDVTFSTTGNTYTAVQTGTTNQVSSGTFQWAQQGNNGGQLVLVVTPAGGGSTNQITYVLTFTSATSGTYTYTASDGTTGSGSFSNLQDVTNSGGNNGGGNNGGGNNGGGNNGGGNNGGGNNGGGNVAPTSLSGHPVDFSAAGGGNERLNFAASGNSLTSDAVSPPNNTATYVYTVTSASAATLVVTFPNGDHYDLNLVFTDATHGTWSGNENYGGADHAIGAGSSFTVQP